MGYFLIGVLASAARGVLEAEVLEVLEGQPKCHQSTHTGRVSLPAAGTDEGQRPAAVARTVDKRRN
jgi:hypothetical protein